MKDFKELCLRTESKDFESISIQANKLQYSLFNNLKQLFIILDNLDVLKKTIFYTKASEYKLDSNPRLENKDTLRLLHAGLGMATEAGEFLQPLLKHIEHGVELDKPNLLEELGDSQWYPPIVLDVLNVSEEAVRKALIEKLEVRFPDKFTQENAENRNLEEEQSKFHILKEENDEEKGK